MKNYFFKEGWLFKVKLKRVQHLSISIGVVNESIGWKWVNWLHTSGGQEIVGLAVLVEGTSCSLIDGVFHHRLRAEEACSTNGFQLAGCHSPELSHGLLVITLEAVMGVTSSEKLAQPTGQDSSVITIKPIWFNSFYICKHD